jgi:2-keto-4-pentenoate hydratase/2-oxohepta-3-ene-1,7-dioic acid hydratase in catechol pathway
MKLATYELGGRQHVGAVVEGSIVDLSPTLDRLIAPSGATHPAPGGGGLVSLLEAGAAGMDAARRQLDEMRRGGRQQDLLPLDRAVLLAPIPRPGKIIGVGRNYADHAAETGVKPFEKPRLFAKLSTSVAGPGCVVKKPAAVNKLDYEAELAVVIGRRAKAVARAEALAYVGGYTILDDVSAREFQFDLSPPQTTIAKSMDGFCPIGPWLVTADEIPDPQSLDVSCWINGELRQQGHTRDMLFDVATLIAYLTEFMTLEPGDVIATGTPAGVGAFMKPPRWLQPGDRIRMEISRIGVLEHTIG